MTENLCGGEGGGENQVNFTVTQKSPFLPPPPPPPATDDERSLIIFY